MSDGRRTYLYTVALLSYFALLAALTFLARRMVEALLSDASFVGTLISGRGTIGLISVGAAAAAWGIHWFLANRAARPLTLTGAAERSSIVRKAWLYLGEGGGLAAAVAQAALGAAATAAAVFGGAAARPVGWIGGVAPLAAGALLAFLFWAYLRWETMRDGDFGREPGRAANWRRAYVYGAVLIGSALALIGAGTLLYQVLTLFNRAAVTGWNERLANAVAALSAGALLALAGWGTANTAASKATRIEMNTLSRVLLRYGSLLAGALGTLASLGYLLAQALLLALGGALGARWGVALAVLPPAVILWLASANGIRQDANAGGEAERTAQVRRTVRYTVALLGLIALCLGLAEFVRLILLSVLRVRPADAAIAAAWWRRFAYAAGMVFAGAPAWWGHWWSQQVRARAGGAAGHAERTSVVRRAYLLFVTLLAGAAVLAALGIAAFLLLNVRAAGDMGVRAALAGVAAAASVALVVAAAHGLTLRGDAAWLAADRRQVSASSVAPGAGAPSSAGPTPGPALSAPAQAIAAERAPAARSYRREELPAFTFAPVRPAPRPLVVIDGRDGVVGAALIAALRKALPDAVLWPVGLNADAQVAMLNALGGGTPPAVPADALDQAAAVLGPSDMLVVGGLGGDVTAELAAALANCGARLLLLPPRDPRLRWVAAPDWPLAQWIENAVIEATNASTGS